MSICDHSALRDCRRLPTLLFCLALLASPPLAGGLADLGVAQEALDDGLFALAQRRAEAVLFSRHATDGARREAFDLLLRALDAAGSIEHMASILGDVPEGVAVAPREADALLGFWRARLAYRQADFETAAALASGAVASAGDTDLRLRAGQLEAAARQALGQKREALAVYERLGEAVSPDHPDWPATMLEWARLLYRNDEPDACLDRLDALPKTGFDDPVASGGWLLRVAAMERMGRVPEAKAALRRLIEAVEAPEGVRGEAALHLARLLRDHDGNGAALEIVRQAVEFLRDSALATTAELKYAVILAETPEHREAGLERLRVLAGATPRDAQAGLAQLALAEALLAAEAFEAAVDAFQQVIESPADAEHEKRAFWGRGWALLELGRYIEAAAAFRKVHERAEDDVWRLQALTKAADALFAGGRMQAAAETYGSLFEQAADPSDAAHAGLQAAESLLRMEERRAAEDRLQQVYARYADLPEGIEAGLRLGRLLAERGAAEEAIDVLTAIAEAHADSVWQARAWLARGRVYYRTFRFDKALRDFQRIRDADHDEAAAEAAFLSAMSLYWMGRDGEALAALETFLERFPASPLRRDAVFWQGRYAYNRQQFDRARERFEHFATVWPEHEWADDALLWAARAAYAADAFGDTLSLTSRLVDRFPVSPLLPDVRFLQGEALAMQARFEDAVLAFNEITTRFPDSNWVIAAWGRKGDCLFTLGKDDPDRYLESVAAYRYVTQRVDAPMEAVLQAAFKVGRSLEKLDRVDEALEWYYTDVMLRYQAAVDAGIWHNDASSAWFARAAFQSADLLEARDQWEAAIRVLRRIARAGVNGSDEARERIRRLSREQRWGLPGTAG